MQLTFHGHSCVTVTTPGGRLVIDPGMLSSVPDLGAADAVLITHSHGDHVDVARVAAAVSAPGGPVAHAPADVLDQLEAAGAPAARLEFAAPGDRFSAAGVGVDVVGLDHAVIHDELPSPANVGYLVGGALLHPGDSLAPVDVDVEVLLLPVAAPWAALGEAIDFARAVAPRLAIPIHDAILSPAGQGIFDAMVSAVTTFDYRRLAVGETLEIGGS